MPVDLQPHPDTTPRPALDLRADLARRDGALAVVFELGGGALADVRVPARATPVFTDGLWRHTCFEVFVARTDADTYVELNLAPSGAWAAYAFAAYRVPVAPSAPWPAPRLRVDRAPTTLALHATLPLEGPWASYRGTPVCVGLTAVIEDATGRRSYWAARHAPGAPDFHHAAVRTVALPGG